MRQAMAMEICKNAFNEKLADENEISAPEMEKMKRNSRDLHHERK